MLFDRGIRATPVDELLREAEVSAATLYTHFGSKDALVAEALRVRLADWRSVWDQHVVAAADDTARLLAVFDALASYRRDQPHPARWCAFLAADTTLLTERLLHLSRPLAGGRAQDLADEVLLAYGGTLAAFLRGTPRSPIEVGRRLASAAVRAHRRA